MFTHTETHMACLNFTLRSTLRHTRSNTIIFLTQTTSFRASTFSCHSKNYVYFKHGLFVLHAIPWECFQHSTWVGLSQLGMSGDDSLSSTSLTELHVSPHRLDPKPELKQSVRTSIKQLWAFWISVAPVDSFICKQVELMWLHNEWVLVSQSGCQSTPNM